MHVLEPSPLNRADAPFGQRGADQPAYQGVTGTRRQAASPGEQVPDHRCRQTGADHRDRLVRRDRDDAGNGVSDGRADQQRAEQVEERGEQDGLQRCCHPGRNKCRDRIRRVVDAVGSGEGKCERKRDYQARVHPRTLVRLLVVSRNSRPPKSSVKIQPMTQVRTRSAAARRILGTGPDSATTRSGQACRIR